MNDPFTRAIQLYFRDYVVRIKKPTVLLDLQQSGYESLNRRFFVVLRTPDGKPVRVYRLRYNGTIRKVLPWPLTFDSPPPSTDERHYYYRCPKNPLEK